MNVTCDRCKKTYNDIFDTHVRIDYAEPGKGKPYEHHLCLSCRKELIKWMTEQG
ncbi:MAG: hypothetical protein JW771_06245 [Candidatus Thermoplasmatota archaeon]|nr:hypothetical protein [Candidatus Thermoplasmatota archaeon]